MQQTTILIVDDYTLIRESWSTILNLEPNYKVVGQCGNGEAAVLLAKKLKPDIAIIEIHLPGINGLETTQLLLKECPKCKILGVSQYSESIYARQMFIIGAMAYVTKRSPWKELLKALNLVKEGKKYICEDLKYSLADELATDEKPQEDLYLLSQREIQILALIKKGNSSKETVKN